MLVVGLNLVAKGDLTFYVKVYHSSAQDSVLDKIAGNSGLFGKETSVLLDSQRSVTYH